MKLNIHKLCLATLLSSAALFAQNYKLVTPNPSPATQALADYMYSVYGKKMISGQMDEKHLSRIVEASGGKEPAIMGYDFYGLKPGTTHGDPPKAIRWAKEKGGIVTISWHWGHPDGSGEFNNLNFDLPKALADTSSGIGKDLVEDLHAAAIELARIQAAGVPVLWRPLHEAEGAWFWWGAHKGDACKKLYRLMFDLFVKQHKLNNLVWIWTSYAGEKEGNWYPGDDVVDMVVYDYPNDDVFSKFTNMFGNNMMFGIGENGPLPDPAKFAKQPYSYFLCWDYMILEPWEVDDQKRKGANEKSWIYKVYNDPLTITLDEVPDYLNAQPIEPTSCVVSTKCEAEDATRSFTNIGTSHSGFSGRGYVEGFTNQDSLKRIDFLVEISKGDFYQIEIGYASPFGAKSFWLTYPAGSLLDTFAVASEGFSTHLSAPIFLQPGFASIGISYGNGYYLIDWIRLHAQATSSVQKQTILRIPSAPQREWNMKGQRMRP